MTLKMQSRFHLTSLFFFIVAFISEPSFSAREKKDVKSVAEIAAIVNEEMISITDLRDRAKFFAATSGQHYSEELFQGNALHILTALINESLQRQQAEFFKIKIGKEEVRNAVINMEKMNGKDEGFLKKLCEQFNIPFSTVEKQMEASLAWDIISREMFRSSLQVSKSEVDSYIRRLEVNRDRPHLHLAEIFVSVDSPEQVQKGRNKINQVLGYLNQGAHFPILAQQFSDSPTKVQGGDIGWIPEEDIDSEIKSAVKGLSVNDFTSPIRTNDGYKIVYLIDRKETSPEMAAQTIYTYKRVNFSLSPMASEQRLMEIFQKASSVAQNSSSCEMFEKLAKTAGEAQIKEVGEVSASDLPPPVLGVLSKLKPCKMGEKSQKCQASPPIRSDIGVLMFMVCKVDKIEAGQIDRKNIENQIANVKLQKLMSREMRNLRRAAHIVNKLEDSVSLRVAKR